MAYYFFVKDFKDGKAAESFVSDWLKEKFHKFKDVNIRELEKEEQENGDLSVEYMFQDRKYNFNVEVKFDKMAESTGNLCFELANKKGKPTGIASTKAHAVIYLVPNGDSAVKLFLFDTNKLRNFIDSDKNIRIVKGGDRKSYALALSSIENVVADKATMLVEDINATV